MRKLFILALIVLIATVFMVSCAGQSDSNVKITLSEPTGNDKALVDAIAIYFTFEEACLEATDVVLAEYQGKSLLNDTFTEYRFAVYDSLLGDAKGEIAVSVRNAHVTVMGENDTKFSYYNKEMPLTIGRKYLLPLYRSPSAYDVKTRYQFLGGLVVDLEDVSQSVMYGEKDIALHTQHKSFNELSEQSIKRYVGELVCNNAPAKTVPTAANLEELVAISPDIAVVKVGKLERIMQGVYQDIPVYYCTVQEMLKTDDSVHERQISVKFFENSVKEGDTVIIFSQNYGTFYYFVSKNTYVDSVQSLDKKDEIIAIIQDQK